MLSVQIQYEGNGKGDAVFSLRRTKNYLLKCYQCKFSMREMEKEMWYSLYVGLNIIFLKCYKCKFSMREMEKEM